MDCWFDAKKNPPHFFGKYLVACEGIDIAQIRKYEGDWDSLNEVLYWMELPKLPKNM